MVWVCRGLVGVEGELVQGMGWLVGVECELAQGMGWLVGVECCGC